LGYRFFDTSDREQWTLEVDKVSGASVGEQRGGRYICRPPIALLLCLSRMVVR
jgi:hypothetical protein